MDKQKHIAMTARMDGKRAIAGRIGRKRKVSEMELVALCTFARVGMMSVFSSLEGETGEMAYAELVRLTDAIEETFSEDGKADGLDRLAECCAALLGGERLGKYVVPIKGI
jgi:hypothetical protein